ncbi:GlxA family transcriptional regulator [Shewanella algae]|uniref:GlxA family transcriptional regulator n=1 Tax=Shewanella algae TaxID=38313 RepID=UPI001AADD745|nr:helix-turn-helix domain-containing protein [Shewanella algae]MBO2584772.1 helix-turn-helix domain-containing protein [Shewanella algae]MBO2656368.1 helix-turn-helix domain-containing protein [Shewanella algae]MDV2963251.1 helix-turn-helix domain-containing protein [Shewanella algae]QTE90950.1 helix-turn-helix domain-containing protein [Shewanella algae]
MSSALSQPQHRIAILVLRDFVAFDLAIPYQMFPLVSLSGGHKPYQVSFCGPEQSICSGALSISDIAPLELLSQVDTVIIPGIRDPLLFSESEVLQALQQAARAGVRLASICTGACVLAAAGLLDNLRATTHWQLTPELAKRYPNIEVEEDMLFVDNGQLLTSAGLAAGQDLCLHMIASDFGAQAAETTADFFVMPLERQGCQSQRIHRQWLPQQQQLANLQLWLMDNLHLPLTLAQLAERACLSQRSLNRKFREQTGLAPMAWLGQARIRRAQSLLESSHMSVELIASSCGFASAAGLRDAFKRALGVSPSNWRKTYSGFSRP